MSGGGRESERAAEKVRRVDEEAVAGAEGGAAEKATVGAGGSGGWGPVSGKTLGIDGGWRRKARERAQRAMPGPA